MGLETAKELKGVYDRGQPLIQLGTVVATSMSLSLVPLITKEKMKRDVIALKEKVQLAFKISILVGVGATMGLWVIIKPTNRMLFENTDGSYILAVLSTLIFFASLIMTVTAILQGLGYTFFPAITILGCFMMKYGLNMILVPKLGTMGAAMSSCLSFLVILVILILKLRAIMGELMINKRFYGMIGIATFIMMIVLKNFFILNGLFLRFGCFNKAYG